MFRDLKEYQDIAKIYAEKVSKPENLEERRGTELSKDQIQKNREERRAHSKLVRGPSVSFLNENQA